MQKKDSDIKVFISLQESTCSECGENLGHHAWITLDKDKGALCLSCSDLDHLDYLPSGDAALTRRAKKNSKLSAVVIKWSRARRRYERQGLLVESEGLSEAEKECLADSEFRERRRERAANRRKVIDQEYVQRFAIKIRGMYPNCPTRREFDIAEYTCLKYSGRIGRSADAKEFSIEAIQIAVIAHIRHVETNYDNLLMRGFERYEARSEVENKVMATLSKWRGDKE
jgi:hypothetical protein